MPAKTANKLKVANGGKGKTAVSETRKFFETDELPTYVRLRGMLDTVQSAALRFYAEGETSAGRKVRAKKIERAVQMLIRDVLDGEIVCPSGMIDCGGYCAYRCGRP